MTAEELMNKTRRREPFVPVRIHLTDGRTFEVKEPHHFIASGGEMVVITPLPGVVPVVMERFNFVDIRLVARVEDLDSAQ